MGVSAAGRSKAFAIGSPTPEAGWGPLGGGVAAGAWAKGVRVGGAVCAERGSAVAVIGWAIAAVCCVWSSTTDAAEVVVSDKLSSPTGIAAGFLAITACAAAM